MTGDRGGLQLSSSLERDLERIDCRFGDAIVSSWASLEGCDGRERLFMEYKVFDVVVELELPRSEGIVEEDDGEAAPSLGAREGSCLCDDGENE